MLPISPSKIISPGIFISYNLQGGIHNISSDNYIIPLGCASDCKAFEEELIALLKKYDMLEPNCGISTIPSLNFDI